MSDRDSAALERNLRSGNYFFRDVEHVKREALRWLSLLPPGEQHNVYMQAVNVRGPRPEGEGLLHEATLWEAWHFTSSPAVAVRIKGQGRTRVHFVRNRGDETFQSLCGPEWHYDLVGESFPCDSTSHLAHMCADCDWEAKRHGVPLLHVSEE